MFQPTEDHLNPSCFTSETQPNVRRSAFFSTVHFKNNVLYQALCLLENGAVVDQARDDGSTAFHDACALGNPDIVQLLLKHGANVDKKDSTGQSAPHIKIKHGKAVLLEIPRVKLEI